MARTTSLRQSLLISLIVVIVALSGAILATVYAGSQRARRTVLRSIVTQTIDFMEYRLHGFFDPVMRELELVRSWGESGLLNDDPSALTSLFAPLVRRSPNISSLMVADERGREYMLLNVNDTWRNRVTRREEWGHRAHWFEWTDDDPEPRERWEDLDYDPRQRPWYIGASSLDASPETLHWTAPYTFFTTKEPGITGSITFDPGDGLQHVIGFDVLLKDITRFTTGLQVADRGAVIVLTDDGRVIGLPRDDRYLDAAVRDAALLKKPAQLGWTLASDAAHAFTAGPAVQDAPVRFTSGGEAWWGQGRPFALTPQRALWIGVVVPESDLLGHLTALRWAILLITGTVLAAAIVRIFVVTRRFSEPIEALVRDSERMSKGDLESADVVDSSVTELRRLADAHDHMRTSLRALMKLERDIQLARQIQQRTFPRELPEIKGYQIEAWSEPAEETGGDTFDIIDSTLDIIHDDALAAAGASRSTKRVVMLLADATGHGIGPALSVTQVRAMLRMAVRSGESLGKLASHMNEQLMDDLPGGRFITAWLGELRPDDHTLQWLSAGQAPLLHYAARQGAVEVLSADWLPLGLLAELDQPERGPLLLERGDLFAVISDGIFESMDPTGEQFGTQRVVDIMTDLHRATPREILQTIRAAVDDFTGSAPADDDRTAIILKRS